MLKSEIAGQGHAEQRQAEQQPVRAGAQIHFGCRLLVFSYAVVGHLLSFRQSFNIVFEPDESFQLPAIVVAAYARLFVD